MVGSSRLTPFVSLSAALFAKASAVYNPFIYVFAHNKFRRVRRLAMPWRGGGENWGGAGPGGNFCVQMLLSIGHVSLIRLSTRMWVL